MLIKLFKIRRNCRTKRFYHTPKTQCDIPYRYNIMHGSIIYIIQKTKR